MINLKNMLTSMDYPWYRINKWKRMISIGKFYQYFFHDFQCKILKLKN